MDAFSASIALGGMKSKNFLITGVVSSVMFGVFQAVMPIIGWGIGETFKTLISGVDHWVAFLLLCVIGGKMIIEDMGSTKKQVKLPNVNLRLITMLALATSIDALVVGMGMAFIDVPLVLAVSVIGIITCILSLVGNYLGSKYCCYFQNKTGLVGGLALVLIGVKIVIDHLFFV